jgi:hypothetical protein
MLEEVGDDGLVVARAGGDGGWRRDLCQPEQEGSKLGGGVVDWEMGTRE